MRTSIKLLSAGAAAALVITYGAATQAGEQPYVAFVDEDSLDCDPADPAEPDAGCFYLSEKLQQFTHTPTDYGAEEFYVTRRGLRTDPNLAPEICDENRTPTDYRGEENYKIFAGNQGDFHWDIVLPKKPEGNLNITIQCGLLKPNQEENNLPSDPPVPEESVINLCAAETGERYEAGAFCTRKSDTAGVSGIKVRGLPTIEATACWPYLDTSTSPPTWVCNPDPAFEEFHLTAYRNPGQYIFTENAAGDALRNSPSMQVLDGDIRSRFALKACMTKSFFVKKPVDDQVNALGETEFALEANDMIRVRVDFPSAHTTDVYCHARSVTVQGIGVAGSCKGDDGQPC